MAAKPVVVDFLGRNAQLKASVAEASATIERYDAQIKASSAAQERLSASNERWARSLVGAAKISAVGVAGLATALGGAALAAASFDASMRNVNSIAGLGPAKFKALEASVLRLSTAVGKSPKDLADGLYSIVSSGFKANDALKILEAGARAARAGLTDTATATGALTGTLNAYGLGAKDAKRVSDLLFQTVNVGVENFQQLAGSLGKVENAGHSLGVSLKDLLGAQAALTRGNLTADEASTQLGALFQSLTKSSPALTKQLKSMGYENGQAAIHALGFKGTLDALEKAVGNNQTAIGKLFPNVRALRGFDGLEGTSSAAKIFTTSLKAMDEATRGAGVTAKVFAEQQKSTSAQFDDLKASVDVAAVTIGQALLPEINKGIDALNKWLTQAQRSGEISNFAKTISKDVQATVSFIEGLGPAAQRSLAVVSSTIHAAIPYAQGFLHVIEAVAPELEAVGHAAAGVTSAIGPSPIIGATLAFVALNRALTTAQAGGGKYASIMRAGAEATARLGGGAVSASGRLDSVGKSAVNATSNAKLFARGLASSFGPQLLAVGAAGIVLSILSIKEGMTNLKDEARQAVEALAQLQDARVAKASANIAVQQQIGVVAGARGTAGSAAVAVANARSSLAGAQASGDPQAAAHAEDALTGALHRQRAAILNLQSAENDLEQDRQDALAANVKLNDAATKTAQQLGGLASKAKNDAGIRDGSGAGASFLGSPQARAAASAAQIRDQQNAVDSFVRSYRHLVDTSTDLTAQGKAAGNRIADVVKQLGAVPDKRQIKIIADDVAAGKSIAAIKKDLGLVGNIVATPRVSADTVNAKRDIDDLHNKITALNNLSPKVHIGSAGFPGVQAAIGGINRSILHLSQTPFTVHIVEATTRVKTPVGASGMSITGSYGADDVPIRVTGQEVVLNPRQQAMVDGGGYTIHGALAATGAPTIRRGGTYASGGGKPKKPSDLQFKAFPLGVYEARATNAQHALETVQGQRKTAYDSYTKLTTAIGHAHEKVATAKTPKTRASYEAAAVALERKSQPLIARLLPLISADDARIQADREAYQRATRVAKAASGFASQIKRQQDLASQANSEMQLASDQYGQAKTSAARAAALKAYQAAQGRRTSANRSLQSLLGQARGAIGDPNSQYFRDTQAAITASQIDESGNVDPTAVPGYQSPDDTATGTLTFLSAEHQYQLDKALQTDANGNPVDPATASRILGIELANAQRGEGVALAGGNFALADEIVQAESSIQGQIASLSQSAAPTQNADTSAQLTQANARVLALSRGQGYDAAAASAFSTGGLGLITILGDMRSASAIASVATKGFSAQAFIPANAGSITV